MFALTLITDLNALSEAVLGAIHQRSLDSCRRWDKLNMNV
jgi:hypothetical protein